MGTDPTASPIEEELLRFIKESLLELEPEFQPTGDLFAAGLDSMAIMQLLLFLEERFETVISPSEVTRENFASPRAIASLIEQKRASRV